MHFIFITIVLLFHICSTHCHDSQSYETNNIEVTPFYDTIIFSDIADIINEFDSNVNPPSDINIDNETDENIEDMLSEYQHYLDRAHKQKKIYIERSKLKNKRPLLRHDNFIKSNTYKNDSFRSNYFNPNLFKFSQTQYKNPLDFIIPININSGHPINPKIIPGVKDIPYMNSDKTIVTEEKVINMQPFHRPLNQIQSTCYCKTAELPCECNCKQCLIPFKRSNSNKYFPDLVYNDGFFKAPQYNIVGKVNQDNIWNLRIKVDISMPKVPDNIGKNIPDNRNEYDEDLIKEISPKVNIPLSYYNFPIPLDMFGYKKIFKIAKHDPATLHKVTIHKKKKPRVNNNSKKYLKKLITFHNIKLEPHQFYLNQVNNERRNETEKNNKTIVNSITPNVTEKIEHNILVTIMPNNTLNINRNETQEIYLTVNITNKKDKRTEDDHKYENSIDNEYTTKINLNVNSAKPIIRLKRNTYFKNSNESQIPFTKLLTNSKDIKKNDKVLLKDTELLYWPNDYENRTDVQSKNITALILMRENKKAKLNISSETIRQNHTQILEKAIFGNVDWNDVDTVAPTLMSFVGKYMRGVLTFCSQNVCHSMKCADKTCVHRICKPEERYNNKGHCTGSKQTDSIASMESIMDLPSNIGFEIVDILQDKILGKIYGKVTLCITSKCISMVASKKIFKKTKCAIKELYSSGHCPEIKSGKM